MTYYEQFRIRDVVLYEPEVPTIPNKVLHCATWEVLFEGDARAAFRFVQRRCMPRLRPRPHATRLWLIWHGTHAKLQIAA